MQSDSSDMQRKLASLADTVNRLDVSFSAVDSRVDSLGRKVRIIVAVERARRPTLFCDVRG